MKYRTIYFLLLCGLFSFVKDTPNYKVVYKINFISNLATKNIKTEFAFLMIDGNQQSSYASENTYKQDSIIKLVELGTLSPYDVMNDKHPKTQFRHFVQKQYTDQSMRISNIIAINNYVYTQKNGLVWQLRADTLHIKNYLCHKATTTYEGRDYVAWYTPEIPISDGPYKFWGLPGLIIKIADTENHYVFELQSFEKYTGKSYLIPFQTRKIFEISYDKFKILSKEFAENPLKVLENETNSKTISINGQDPSLYKNKKQPNPIERY